MSETTEIVTPLVKAINKIPGCYVQRNNAGRRGGVRLAKKNTPDISGNIGHRAVYIEVKNPGQKPTKGQLAFLRTRAKDGAMAFWVDSIAAGIAMVKTELHMQTRVDRKCAEWLDQTYGKKW